MKNVAVGLWMIAILLLGFMAPAFAGDPHARREAVTKGALSARMQFALKGGVP